MKNSGGSVDDARLTINKPNQPHPYARGESRFAARLVAFLGLTRRIAFGSNLGLELSKPWAKNVGDESPRRAVPFLARVNSLEEQVQGLTDWTSDEPPNSITALIALASRWW